jgi:hypothetical protein
VATETELANQAVDHAQATTISWDEYLSRIRTNTSYKYKNTQWYEAGKDLEATKHLEPAPEPPQPQPTPGLAAKAQKLVFCAQAPLTALGAPASYIPCLTADPGYASFVDASVISQLRAKFKTIAAWGVQTQIPVRTIRDFAARWALDYVILQGETSDEYRTAIEAGANVIVGNSNSWSESQRQDATARINRGELAFSFETYTNEGAPWPRDSSSAGVPAASFCLGRYAARWNPTLADYKANTPASAWPLVSVYHAAACTPADWALLVP